MQFINFNCRDPIPFFVFIIFYYLSCDIIHLFHLFSLGVLKIFLNLQIKLYKINIFIKRLIDP